MRNVLPTIGFLFSCCVLSAQPPAVELDAVEFSSENWMLNKKAKITRFEGRNALTGTALLKDVEFLNGSMEVDIWSKGARNFAGFTFRVQSASSVH